MSNYGGRGVFGGNVPRISADDVRHQWQQKHVEKSQPKQQTPTGQKRRERAMNRDTGKRDSSGPLGSPGRRQRDEYIARGESTNSNFKVVIRVRPPLPRELNGDAPFQNIVAVDQSFRTITLSENPDDVDEEGYRYKYGPYSTHRFTFDHVYDQSASQENVYNNTAKGVVDSALQGYNATIFACVHTPKP